MPSTLILFGAFDRHNFGDLLFPHIVSKLLSNNKMALPLSQRERGRGEGEIFHKTNFKYPHKPGPPIHYAGLADRDLRPWGGHPVKSLASIRQNENTTLIHCGGELLTCRAYQAAVMLQAPDQAELAIRQFDADPVAAARWAAEELHTNRSIPYVASPNSGRSIFNAVGGVEWPLLGPDQQEEVMDALKQARWVSVRDQVTQACLQAAGITASLCPDPAVMVKECFGEVIQQHSRQGEVAEAVRKFPNGYIACQFSAEFGDDATLDQLANGLGRVCSKTGLGVVLFRAGAAPWHDQLGPYASFAARMPSVTVHVFKSLHLWDICALIASSRAFCGSSLHGSIVAMAYGLPHVSLISPQHSSRPGKVAAYLETWEQEALPCSAKVNEVDGGLILAMSQPKKQLGKKTAELTKLYIESQSRWMTVLDQ